MSLKSRKPLMRIFELLYDAYGPLRWWPAETRFEVCVGAILTQNTAWTNVEKAIITLKEANALTPGTMNRLDGAVLAELIRPSGYFNSKSRTLREFVAWLFTHHAGSLERMFAGDWQELRRMLLAVRGIGPETADSILLYAGDKPTFVVDSYTRRLFHRLGFLTESAGYDRTRQMFMDSLPADVQLFNDYHALIVEQCKRFCRKKPVCEGCPLSGNCPSKLPSL